MPTLSTAEAAEKLATRVESAKPSELPEVFSEMFPDKSIPTDIVAGTLAHHIRKQLVAEEIVDLWNAIFPEDSDVWYDEERQLIRYNEQLVGHAD